jgi:cob(I)alamin adenosyltransferase
MKIYTKTGDKGQTSLIGGTKVSKGHLKIESYGTVDELNSFIGVIRDSFTDTDTNILLERTQNNLFNIGAQLATVAGTTNSYVPKVTEEEIESLEKAIDKMDESLTPLRNFILPGGHIANSYAHVARCVCRRAERCVVRLMEEEEVDPLIIKYMNRLSDYLFALARFISHQNGSREVEWKKHD